jgi:protein-S-isoprenylcysteine O-methyltransferase Ste14
VQAAGISLTSFSIPAVLDYVSAVLLFLGIASIIPAFLHLGSDSRLGVSDESGELRTTGIYQISRNPMYLGFYLVTLASLVSVPHLVNAGCGLLGIYVHHRIILAEERFLLKEHGAAYEAYRRRVRRYI